MLMSKQGAKVDVRQSPDSERTDVPLNINTLPEAMSVFTGPAGGQVHVACLQPVGIHIPGQDRTRDEDAYTRSAQPALPR